MFGEAKSSDNEKSDAYIIMQSRDVYMEANNSQTTKTKGGGGIGGGGGVDVTTTGLIDQIAETTT